MRQTSKSERGLCLHNVNYVIISHCNVRLLWAENRIFIQISGAARLSDIGINKKILKGKSTNKFTLKQ